MSTLQTVGRSSYGGVGALRLARNTANWWRTRSSLRMKLAWPCDTSPASSARGENPSLKFLVKMANALKVEPGVWSFRTVAGI